MATSIPLLKTTGCDIELREGRLHGVVGPGLAQEVQECYRAIINECLQRQCTRTLVVGVAKADAFDHLACRDALRAMALAGAPAGFRLALVAQTPNLISIYDAAVIDAGRLGIEARRFMTEDDAVGWLES